MAKGLLESWSSSHPNGLLHFLVGAHSRYAIRFGLIMQPKDRLTRLTTHHQHNPPPPQHIFTAHPTNRHKALVPESMMLSHTPPSRHMTTCSLTHSCLPRRRLRRHSIRLHISQRPECVRTPVGDSRLVDHKTEAGDPRSFQIDDDARCQSR